MISKENSNQTSSKHEQRAEPGEGIRRANVTTAFRIINFELFTRPNKIIMGIGIACLTGAVGYISYMRYKYEGMGYYVAVRPDGEVFIKKDSKWDT